MAAQPHDFRTIRSWDGSQARAFEELCYQLRDPTPDGAEVIKPGDPDAGVEWYVRFRNGVEWGWQAKYSFEIDTLLGQMEKSLRTVVAKRPKCRRLAFCIPFDLPDARLGNERKSAQQKFDDRKVSWIKRIPGAERVRIDLVAAGDLLDRLASHPAQRGKAWFFWSRDVFSPEWCRERLGITLQAAGDRYTPELHIELPVAFAVEGLALSSEFWTRYREARGAVLIETAELGSSRTTGLGRTRELQELRKVMESFAGEVLRTVTLPRRFSRTHYLQLAERAEECCDAAMPPRYDDAASTSSTPKPEREQQIDHLRYRLTRLSRALSGFVQLLETPSALAAERGALLLVGDAGQGKTHLFCDAASRALERDQPAVVLLGGRFSGRRAWSDAAEQLGLGQIGSEQLLDGMRAAAEASGAPFLLLVDALNEAADPAAWQHELPAFIAEATRDRWVSLGLTVRSPFLPVVLPSGGLGSRVAEVEHPGFGGRELEATERFFDAYGLEQPRVPLLTPEFTNPLFLKLYCEGLRALGLPAPSSGEAHISEVFDWYLQAKAERIVGQLRLDPADRPVDAAVRAVSDALAQAGRDTIPRTEAKQLVDGFAPGLQAWPNTLFGQLLNEGVLVDDVAWDSSARNSVPVVRFAYQRFADYRVVASLLDGFATVGELRAATRARQPLRTQIRSAPPGWIEALSVQIPERFGVELLDLARWRLDAFDRRIWDRALLRSVVSRRPDAVTDRTRDLLTAAQKSGTVNGDAVLAVLLTVAPIPQHPLNANRLHAGLMRWSMPERDVRWSIATYGTLETHGALDRLIRWIARGPDPRTSDEVVELAAIPAIWTLTSPDRLLRDYATKALSKMLSKRIPTLGKLMDRFRGVNDPYVTERLALIAYGALLLQPGTPDGQSVAVARSLRALALDREQMPNILARDAVCGAYEWCLRYGLVERAEYDEVLPPYGSAPPTKPRTKKQLDRAYEPYRRDRTTGEYTFSEYSVLFSSLFDLGDFGRYVVGSTVAYFSQFPLSAKVPRGSRWRQPRPNRERLAEIEAALTSEQRASLRPIR